MYWAYRSVFLLRMSSMGPRSLLKLLRSMLTTLLSVRATMVACLGWFLIRANSPK